MGYIYRKPSKSSLTSVETVEGEPIERKIDITTSSAAATSLRGDMGRLLSITNHRLYRQGRDYQIRIGAHKSYTGRAQVFAIRSD